MGYLNILFLFTLLCFYFYADNKPLPYEIFMWCDLGIINDVRFLSVAPHWYFRPYTGWLILCPYHYIGIFGLIYFMVSFHSQPNIQNSVNSRLNVVKSKVITFFENSFLHKLPFSVFLLCILHTVSFLPYERFYISIGGNFMAILSYMCIYLYLSFPMVLVIRYNIFVSGNYSNQNSFIS